MVTKAVIQELTAFLEMIWEGTNGEAREAAALADYTLHRLQDVKAQAMSIFSTYTRRHADRAKWWDARRLAKSG